MGGSRTNWREVETRRRVSERGTEPAEGDTGRRPRLDTLGALFHGDAQRVARLMRYLSVPLLAAEPTPRNPADEKWLRAVLGKHSRTRAYYNEN